MTDEFYGLDATEKAGIRSTLIRCRDTGTFLTLMGGHLATKKPQLADSAVNIEVGKIKIGWQGASALGLIVAGILVIVLGFLGYGKL